MCTGQIIKNCIHPHPQAQGLSQDWEFPGENLPVQKNIIKKGWVCKICVAQMFTKTYKTSETPKNIFLLFFLPVHLMGRVDGSLAKTLCSLYVLSFW